MSLEGLGTPEITASEAAGLSGVRRVTYRPFAPTAPDAEFSIQLDFLGGRLIAREVKAEPSEPFTARFQRQSTSLSTFGNLFRGYRHPRFLFLRRVPILPPDRRPRSPDSSGYRADRRHPRCGHAHLLPRSRAQRAGAETRDFCRGRPDQRPAVKDVRLPDAGNRHGYRLRRWRRLHPRRFSGQARVARCHHPRPLLQCQRWAGRHHRNGHWLLVGAGLPPISTADRQSRHVVHSDQHRNRLLPFPLDHLLPQGAALCAHERISLPAGSAADSPQAL